MNKKAIIIPILILLAVTVILDRIAAAYPPQAGGSANIPGGMPSLPGMPGDDSDLGAGALDSASTSAGSMKAKIFTDLEETFSFSFPEQFYAMGSELGLDQWSLNSQIPGKVLATVVIPRSFQPKTNFSEGTFTVGMSGDAAAIASCLTANNGESADGAAKIAGVTFSKFLLSDAAAGNRYDTASYRTVRKGACYALERMIHSTAIGAYDPSQGISEFDRAKIDGILEAMVMSFRFLK